jgi:hypothetical protein
MAFPVVNSLAAICAGELAFSVRVLLKTSEGCTALMASKNDFDRYFA